MPMDSMQYIRVRELQDLYGAEPGGVLEEEPVAKAQPPADRPRALLREAHQDRLIHPVRALKGANSSNYRISMPTTADV